MTRTLLASAGLLATATLVNAMGSAVVVNQCSYPVSLTNVPASGGGQNQIGPQSLSTGGSYSQVYTPLSNDQGWSIKLSIGNSEPLQYEYTTHSDGTIWFDLSAVNGDPFNGNWFISSEGGCSPKQAAYQFPTDDAAAMQSCTDSSTVTVTLCANGGSAQAPPSAPSAPAGPSSPMASPQVPAPSVPAPSVPEVPVSAPSVAAPSIPSAAPSVDSAPSAAPSADSAPNWGPPADKVGGFQQLQATPNVVTNVHTKVVTQWVTVSPSPIGKRSEHLHRHAERHNHF